MSEGTGKTKEPDNPKYHSEAGWTTVKLHTNHFRDPGELSRVLQTILHPDRFRITLNNNMYYVLIKDYDPNSNVLERLQGEQ
ncbi:hypothetical protein GGR57DRAFT_486599 [Xylariaceae sp. FL1272]|nr:hypothetical protein GGR57DRAFT_486599 [Xylariaceae sp. FL1272]